MKFDRNPERQAQRVDQQKANRPTIVSKVPEHGRNGDTVVVMDDDGVSDVLMRVEDEWISLLTIDGTELTPVPEYRATTGVSKSVRIRYRVPAGHPRTRPTRFVVKFTDETGETITPSDVVISPSVPSKIPGTHLVTITFTPQSTGHISVDLTLE